MDFSIRRGAIIVGISLVSAAGAPRLSGQVVLRGILYDDANGTRLRGTVMLVDPATDAPVIHTTTDTLGQFTMRFSGGTFQVAAIHPGYTSILSAPMSFQSGERLTIRIPIAADGDPTHQIGVLEHIRPGEGKREVKKVSVLDDYNRRKAIGMGLHYEQPQLARSPARTIGAFLQTVPGVRVTDPSSVYSMSLSRAQGTQAAALMSGAGCRLAWFIDGHRIDIPGRNDALTEGLGSISLDDIAALEIFRGLSEIPSEFAAPDVRCGAVAVWTRVG